MSSQPFLVVVHPGSLCGSLDLHRGEAASEIREAIASEIENWPGPVAVVHGDLSDELQDDDYIDLRCAVDGCSSFETVGEATEKGLAKAARQVATAFALKAGAEVTVTGAWADKDGSGCVTAVVRALIGMGFAVNVSSNVPASDG